MKKFTIGQTVQYDYDQDRTRTGEVVEYNETKNRYRVFWHTETSKRSSTWTGNPNKRTWIKAETLRAEG